MGDTPSTAEGLLLVVLPGTGACLPNLKTGIFDFRAGLRARPFFRAKNMQAHPAYGSVLSSIMSWQINPLSRLVLTAAIRPVVCRDRRPKLREFLRRFIAPKKKKAASRESESVIDYKGYTIRPTPKKEGGLWLTEGVITKEFAGEVKERYFIRADIHRTKEDADASAIAKAKRIIDEEGDRLFDEESR